MPSYLRGLALICIGATLLTILVFVFGPQEGLETLGSGLLAYFVFLFHLLAGVIFLAHLFSPRVRGLAYGSMLAYFAVIWGIGFYQVILINDLDDAARNFVEEKTDPASFQIRDLGRTLYVESMRGGVSPERRARWHALLTEEFEPNRKDEDRLPALWYAAALGDDRMVEGLLERGAKTDDDSLYWTTPLAAAVERGHVSTVRLLIERGADPNAGENKHYPSVSLAAKKGDLDMIEALIEGGADVNLGSPAAFSTALRAERADIVATLLDAGAEPQVYLFNEHPLEVAIENDDEAMIELLIERTDGFERVTNNRRPMLLTAFYECDLARFERYLELGAHPDVRDEKDWTILSRVVSTQVRNCDASEKLAFARALIDADATLDAPNPNQEPPAHLALRKKNPGAARALVEAGADLAGEASGADFLMLAAWNGANDLVALALERGFDPNEWRDGAFNGNALHAAAREGHAETVRMLLNLGTQIPDNSTRRRNLFRFAAEHPAALEPLLEAFAAIETERRARRYVARAVQDSDNEASIELLERLGFPLS